MITKWVLATSVFALIEAASKRPSFREANLANSNNQFGFDVFSALQDKESNVLLSPWSLYTALGMLYIGSKGDTLKEIETVLHLQDTSPQWISQTFGELQTMLKPSGKLYELNMFNAAVVQEGYGILSKYREKLRKFFRGDIYEVDFIKHGDLVTEWLNAWTKLKTGGRIKDILSSVPDPLSRLMLISADYFKGIWETEFNPNHTNYASFFNRGRLEVVTPTMEVRGNFSVLYSGDSDVYAVDLPMVGGISVLLMMPSKHENFATLEKNISFSYLEAVVEKMTTQEIQLYIPKFKLESKLDVQDALQSLGMTSAFSFQSADFSEIATSEGLFVSGIVHHVGVAVNEDGAEAAAASTVTITTRSGSRQLHFDRPFLFFIVDTKADVVLFMGRVTTL